MRLDDVMRSLLADAVIMGSWHVCAGTPYYGANARNDGGKKLSWEGRAARFLKAELKRADVSYKKLAERLKKHGLQEIEASIANKLSRGTFAATFFLASLVALGCEAVMLEDI